VWPLSTPLVATVGSAPTQRVVESDSRPSLAAFTRVAIVRSLVLLEVLAVVPRAPTP
jgi:hypothetical protein